MPDSLCTDELVRQVLDIARLAAQDHHFQARIVIKMGMERRDDHFVMLMLQIGELFGKESSVMIVDQSHCSHDRSP